MKRQQRGKTRQATPPSRQALTELIGRAERELPAVLHDALIENDNLDWLTFERALFQDDGKPYTDDEAERSSPRTFFLLGWALGARFGGAR